MIYRVVGIIARTMILLGLLAIGVWLGIYIFSTNHTSLGDASVISAQQTDNIKDLDDLSQSFAQYMAQYGTNAAVVIYDEHENRYYEDNMYSRFDTASAIKVPIMLAFLHMRQEEDMPLSADDQALLTAMVEASDNTSATQLYSEIGNAPGLTSYFDSIDMAGLYPITAPWGYSQVTPLTMVTLLKDLQSGNLLSSSYQSYAMNLLDNIDPDEQFGLGDPAPGNANIAMKDGWVNKPDGDWIINSSGIVQLGNDTYIISVFVDNQDDLPDAESTIDALCAQLYQAIFAQS